MLALFHFQGVTAPAAEDWGWDGGWDSCGDSLSGGVLSGPLEEEIPFAASSSWIHCRRRSTSLISVSQRAARAHIQLDRYLVAEAMPLNSLSPLETHSRPACLQFLHGLVRSHFALARRQASQKWDPTLPQAPAAG